MPSQHNELATAKEITAFVLRNLHTRFSPLELSRQFDVSENFIKRRIKQLLSKSLAESLHEKRMKLALTLLHEGHPQKEIAKKLGYTSKSHFSAAFRKHYGSAPNVYLKKK